MKVGDLHQGPIDPATGASVRDDREVAAMDAAVLRAAAKVLRRRAQRVTWPVLVIIKTLDRTAQALEREQRA